MTYIIIVLLSITNLFITYKKIKKENVLNKYKRYKCCNKLIILNISTLIIEFAYIVFNYIVSNKLLIIDIILNIILLITCILLIIKHTKNKIKNNVIEPTNYLSTISILLILSILIGDRGDIIDVSSILILPTIISLVLLVVTMVKNNIKIKLLKDKEPEDEKEKKKWKYNKKVYINNILYLSVITIVILLLISDNSIASYIAYIAINLIALLYIIKRIKKIKEEQIRLINGLNDKNKIGKEYIFDFQNDIIITRTIAIYIIIMAIAILMQRLLNITYIIVAVQLLLIVLYIAVLNKTKLNKIYDSLNKKALSKDYKKIENIELDDISIEDKLLEIKYDKVIYTKDNNIYYSEELLYNIKDNDMNKIDLYINTSKYNDYVFIVEEIFK